MGFEFLNMSLIAVNIKSNTDLLLKEITGNSFWKILAIFKNGMFVIKRINEPGYYILKTRPRSCSLINNEISFYFKIHNIKPKHINILPLIDCNLNICINNINHVNFVIPKKTYSLKEYVLYKYVINEFSVKIIETLQFIHSLGYAHLDITPDNIVFDIPEEPYIIDFKCVSHFDKNESDLVNNKILNINSNIFYQSLDLHFKIKSKRSDLISYGFILYQQLHRAKALPWTNEVDIGKIIKMKMKFFDDLSQSSLRCPILSKYFQIIFSRDVFEDPDYNSLFELFKS